MADITHAERIERLEYAKWLVDVAASRAPDEFTRRAVREASIKILRRYGFSMDYKKKMALELLRKEGSLVRLELVEMLGFQKGTVDTLIALLVADGSVFTTRLLPTGSRGGRPRLLVTIVE